MSCWQDDVPFLHFWAMDFFVNASRGSYSDFEMDFSTSFGQDTVTNPLGIGFVGTVGGALIFAVATFFFGRDFLGLRYMMDMTNDDWLEDTITPI